MIPSALSKTFALKKFVKTNGTHRPHGINRVTYARNTFLQCWRRTSQYRGQGELSATTYTRITLLFFVLTGLLMLIGYAIGLYFGDPLTFTLLGLVLAGVVNFVSYYWSDTIVVKMTRAKIIQEGDNPTLFAVVERVAQKAQIPMPRAGIVNSPQPNAFAT